MALYLFEIFNRTLNVWCQRGYNHMSRLRSMRFDEDAIQERAERFWKVLWQQRALFFRACVMDQHIVLPNQSEPVPLRTIYTECITEMAGVLKEIGR